MNFITSKSDNLSGPNHQTLHSYFELGWEVTTTHFDAKFMLAAGKINPDKDRIVTLRGREFLYSKLIGTIAWEDYAKQRGIVDARNIPKQDTDLTPFYANTASCDWNVYHHGPELRYKFENEIKHLIVSLDTPDVSTLGKEPFALCCWRYRHNHVASRNTPPDTAKTINHWLTKRYSKVYVVGHDAEPLCDGQSIVHVDLPTFAGLCLSPNCQVVAGAMTGTMQLAAILVTCGLGVYQHNAPEPVNHMNHPCVMGECVNLWRNKRFVMYQPHSSVSDYLLALDRLCTKMN